MHIVEAPTDVELDEVLGSTKLRDEFGDQKKGVFVFDCHGVEGSVVPDQVKGTIFFLMKNTRAVMENLKDWICPVYKFSLKKMSSFFCSIEDKGYTLDDLGSNLEMSSIV